LRANVQVIKEVRPKRDALAAAQGAALAEHDRLLEKLVRARRADTAAAAARAPHRRTRGRAG
jgi:hypothetical protein